VEGRPLEDQQLVARAGKGDTRAYEELVHRYQGVAHRVAQVVLGDEAEAQDAAQEAFVKAYYALGRFRPGASFRPWLLTIVANEARNRRRSLGRRSGLALRLAEDRSAEDAAPSPEAAVLGRERREALVAALNGLRVDDRLVIAYRYFEHLSEAEMAIALGCRPGTVKSRLARALARLRAVLEAERAEASASPTSGGPRT
jgi:RNA polymerase sigma-70 factor (ECF subfamily)